MTAASNKVKRLWSKIKDTVTELLNLVGRKSGTGGNQIWCIVANVVAERPVGEDKVSRKGTKHFSAGAKVYCYPPLWGDGYEHIKVIGRHRGSRKLVEIVMPSKWLTNWRVKIVYSPFVLTRMKDHWDDSKESQQTAASIVARMTGLRM